MIRWLFSTSLMLATFCLAQESKTLFQPIVQAQVTVKLGKPVNALGFKAHLHLVHPYFEVGVGVQSNLFLRGLGPKGHYFENRLQWDAKLVWGDEFYRNPLFFHALFNHSQKRYSLAYAHYFYWDSRNTSQRSGAWSSELGRIFLYFENDLFASQGRDRFRTGTLQIAFRDSLNYFQVNARFWTGETRGAPSAQYAYKNMSRAYKNLSEQLYGKESNGILSLSYQRAQHLAPFGLELGIDDERIRHFFQNKLIHDFPYAWKKNLVRNKHLPMLDQLGQPYLDPATQRKKKATLVIQGTWGFDEK